jgi:hypothetical protein
MQTTALIDLQFYAWRKRAPSSCVIEGMKITRFLFIYSRWWRAPLNRRPVLLIEPPKHTDSLTLFN